MKPRIVIEIVKERGNRKNERKKLCTCVKNIGTDVHIYVYIVIVIVVTDRNRNNER